MKPLHIAVGVVSDTQGRILISERKPDCAYAGQWEFPGGKCEPGEDVQSALKRELDEELGIQLVSAQPLIRLSHRYPDRHVLLDTWRVTAWRGCVEAREGQRFDWVAPTALDGLPMLAANRPIVRAAQLPDLYLITPEPELDQEKFVDTLVQSLATGVRLVRLRATNLSRDAYQALAKRCLNHCRQHDARLLLDRDAEMVEQVGADGLHLTSTALVRLQDRPIVSSLCLAASCHDLVQLQQALSIGVDFAVLGPVAATQTHQDAKCLGWQGFAGLVDELPLPVYGIGGLDRTGLETAWQHGAQGIAAIRGLWQA